MTYPDWPSTDAFGSEVSGKRKRGSIGGKEGSASKRGRGGRGWGWGSSSERPVAAKVSLSRAAVLKPKPVAPVAPAAGAAGVRRRERRIPGLGSVPIVDVGSDDEDEESEKAGSDVGEEEKVDVSSSDGSSDSGGRGDDDDDGDEEETVDRRQGVSDEFGPDGEGVGADLDAGHEVMSHPSASSSRPYPSGRRRCGD